MDEKINKIYTDPSNPGGFAGAHALYAEVKKKHPSVKRAEFEDFLQRNTTYTLFKPKREKFRRLKTVPAGFMTGRFIHMSDLCHVPFTFRRAGGLGRLPSPVSQEFWISLPPIGCGCAVEKDVWRTG